MRQFSTIILVIFTFSNLIMPANCAYKGGVIYSIPIEYKNLSESELVAKADKYFQNAQISCEYVNEDITSALTLYSILQNLNPNNISYSVKLGILYDKLGKDRQAKGNFSRAIGIDSARYEPYFYFGEFYYNREQYRQALKYYNLALERSESPDYELYYKIGDIHEKFGDTKQSIKYLKLAESQKPSSELSSKIMQVETADVVNKVYYKK